MKTIKTLDNWFSILMGIFPRVKFQQMKMVNCLIVELKEGIRNHEEVFIRFCCIAYWDGILLNKRQVNKTLNNKVPHLTIDRMSRQGRTVLFKLSMGYLIHRHPADLEFYIIVLKGNLDFHEYGNLKQVKRVASDMNDVNTCVEVLEPKKQKKGMPREKFLF